MLVGVSPDVRETGPFDETDPDQLSAVVSVALRQIGSRAAGTAQYAPVPAAGSAQREDLVAEMQLAAIEAGITYVGGPKTKWQIATDAAYNAGRRVLYGSGREVPASAFASEDVDDEGTIGQSPFDAAWSEGQPWDLAEGQSEADLDRPYSREERPTLPREWTDLRKRLDVPSLYGGPLADTERTIVLNWGMDAKGLAALTGLSESAVRQRKHRLVEDVRSRRNWR